MEKVKVAINGYGVIGKRVADAVMLQPDMELIGVSDVASDWRIKVANIKEIPVYAFGYEAADKMEHAGIEVSGTLDDLLKQAEIVVDCAPKKFGAQNTERYRRAGVKFIVQGGEKHETTGHSFVAESNYDSALGIEATRAFSVTQMGGRSTPLNGEDRLHLRGGLDELSEFSQGLIASGSWGKIVSSMRYLMRSAREAHS